MLLRTMLTCKAHISRTLAWDAFLSRGAVGRPHNKWTTTVASYRPPTFENSEPRRQKQAYFKGASEDTRGGRQLPKQNQSSGATSRAANEAQRLAKVMASAGVASRRACEDLIEKGEVKVNGNIVNQQGTLVNPEKDVIYVNGKKLVVSNQPKLYYIMVNKPKGYICSNVETIEGRGKRVVDIMAPWLAEWERRNKGPQKSLPPRLFTVGRLDVASHGLILLTNDGHWAQRVIHPSSNLTKEYIVMVDKVPKRHQLETLLAGAEVDGVHVSPVEVSVLEESTKLRITVAEGKKHEGTAVAGGEEGIDSIMVNAITMRAAEGMLPSESIDGGSSASPSTSATVKVLMNQQTSISQPHNVTADPQQSSPINKKTNKCLPGVPRIDSSVFIYEEKRFPDGNSGAGSVNSSSSSPLPGSEEGWGLTPGQRIWLWNIAPWLRLSAEVRLRRDLEAIAPPTYVDGRPKRKPKEARIQDKGFENPDSPPNAFTLEEWGKLTSNSTEQADELSVVRGKQPSGGTVDDLVQRNVLRVYSGSKFLKNTAASHVAQQGVHQKEKSGISVDGNGFIKTGIASFLDRTDDTFAHDMAAGWASHDKEPKYEDLLTKDLVCREDWDWKVRLLVAAAGLEVLSLKRVRIGGLRIPPVLGLGGYKEMTLREIKAVTDLSQQQELRRNAWESASVLLVKDKTTAVTKATAAVPSAPDGWPYIQQLRQ
ncbi:hypothetical protein CEUSTIGMA_g3379.t1 [Chlamydomonas eustigma]|uniref:RNA-binding S4 domain-containing protein n=1 Tax=Chlamydomonas eustigma TaxID=1157962 RepID=A0A250WYS5_9CHLO|nr:hypothetical protein CEUSTIGMA_g3379.t1 [Chlamydomonas eustigma]|eukprot:GAX75936.1 hypothetical protein CEUSTIGMA_g3379.t1 [Chlamydomonas eustigma]